MWVDSGVGVPIGAEVKVTDTGQLRLIDDEGKVQTSRGDRKLNTSSGLTPNTFSGA